MVKTRSQARAPAAQAPTTPRGAPAAARVPDAPRKAPAPAPAHPRAEYEAARAKSALVRMRAAAAANAMRARAAERAAHYERQAERHAAAIMNVSAAATSLRDAARVLACQRLVEDGRAVVFAREHVRRAEDAVRRLAGLVEPPAGPAPEGAAPPAPLCVRLGDPGAPPMPARFRGPGR